MKRIPIMISLKEKQEMQRTAKILKCGVSALAHKALTHFSRSDHTNRWKNPQLRRRRYEIAKITRRNGTHSHITSWRNQLSVKLEMIAR